MRYVRVVRDDGRGMEEHDLAWRSDDEFNEATVLADVGGVLQPGTSATDIVRLLVPLAFRLLCRAAFR